MSNPTGVGSVQGGLTGATQTISVQVAGYNAVGLQLAGTFTATVVFEATIDNLNWVSLALAPSGGGDAVTSATAAGLWAGNCGGFYAVRARCSAYTSGTAYVALNASVVIAAAVVPGVSASFLTSTDETATLTGSRQVLAGDNITLDDGTPGELTIAAADPGLANGFTSVPVSGQTTVTASGATALTLAAGNNVTLTTDNTAKSVTITATNPGLANAFTSVPVAGQTTVTASGSTALTFAAGSNVTLTTNNSTKTVTIAASGGGGSLTPPLFTVTGLSLPLDSYAGVGPWVLVSNGLPFQVAGTSVQGITLPGFDVVLPPGIVTFSSSTVAGFMRDLDFSASTGTLTTVSLPTVTAIGGALLLGGTNLTTLDLSGVVVIGGDLSVGNNAHITSMDLSALVSLGTAGGGALGVSSYTAMTTLNLASLTDVSQLDVTFDSSLTTLTLSSLARVYGAVGITNNPSLVSLDLSTLVSTLGDLDFSTNIALTTVTFSALKAVGGALSCNGAALSEATVNALLTRFAGLDGTGGTTSYDNLSINLSSGTNAAPTGAGLTAQATLEGRGNTVTVNHQYAITAAVSGAGTFAIAGNHAAEFTNGVSFVVGGSTGNNGTYTVDSSVFGAATVITVQESVSSNVGDGSIYVVA